MEKRIRLLVGGVEVDAKTELKFAGERITEIELRIYTNGLEHPEERHGLNVAGQLRLVSEIRRLRGLIVAGVADIAEPTGTDTGGWELLEAEAEAIWAEQTRP